MSTCNFKHKLMIFLTKSTSYDMIYMYLSSLSALSTTKKRKEQC